MTPELIYMLKVNVGIALFYAFYKLFCGSDTFFKWRRIALLSFLTLSFLYPLLNIQTWIKEQPAIYELTDYYTLLITGNTNTNNEIATTTVTAPTPTLMTLFTWVYFIGVALLSARFIIQLLSIFRLSLISKEETVNGIRIKNLPYPNNPFSFWHWVFIYLPELKENERQEILTHELTHTRQLHSIDVIASEVVNIICWMNPFMWLLKGEIRLNLEYLADHTVMESGTNRQQYQYHLLGLANQHKQTGLYNNFNLLHLKKRIIMMNKRRTRTAGRIKYALFAPLTAALLLVSNIETVARTTERITNEVVETVAAIQTPKPGAVDTPAVYQDNDQIFTIVEVMPEFVDGGMQGCLKFLMDNTKYPEQAKRDKISGKVSVKFVIEKDGSITDAKVVRTDNPVFNEEALRVVNSMPKWKPGKQRGENVNVRFSVPVMFRLQGPAPSKGKEIKQADLEEVVVVAYGPKEDSNANATDAKSGTALKVAEVMPKFPGGIPGLMQYLARNIKYPTIAQKNKEQGRVILQMIVGKDGSISNIKVLRSISPLLDAEAIRVVSTMPKWEPGQQGGQAIAVEYTLPIVFKLQ